MFIHCVIIPIAIYQLVVLQQDYEIINLKVYDKFFPSKDHIFYIDDLPYYGELSQLSHVYSNYGYEPKNGYSISNNTRVNDHKGRVYYEKGKQLFNNKDVFSYYAVNRKTQCVSKRGEITIVSSNGIITKSDFLIDNENWLIIGNKKEMDSIFSKTTIGTISYYIYGNDNLINTSNMINGIQKDKSLWYFQAPNKFLGNIAVAYGGNIEFDIVSFSGDFSKKTSENNYAVILECDSCNKKLGIPISNVKGLSEFMGNYSHISISLLENTGWLEEDKSIGLLREVVNKCDIIFILSNISAIQILGDWTLWYETVAIDNVVIRNEKSIKLPIC